MVYFISVRFINIYRKAKTEFWGENDWIKRHEDLFRHVRSKTKKNKIQAYSNMRDSNSGHGITILTWKITFWHWHVVCSD